MATINTALEISLVCLNCGKELHWFQQDIPHSGYTTLRVETNHQCSTMCQCQFTIDVLNLRGETCPVCQRTIA